MSLAAVLAAVALAIIRCLAVDTPLGHDEAVYAVAARGLLEGTPTSGWGLHRPVGMHVIAGIGMSFDHAAWALRLLPGVLAMGFFLALYRFGRCLFGPQVALGAVACLATSQHILRRSSELLSDLGAAALLVVLGYVIVIEFERERGPTWKFLLVAPLGAAAFYLRYGVSLALIAIAGAGLLAWHQRILAAWRVVLLTFLFLLLLLAPHFVWSHQLTGKAFGILELSGELAGRKFLGEGLLDYLQMMSSRSLGAPVTALFAIGILYGGWLVLARKANAGQVFAFLVGITHVALTGLLSHGEPRYIFFSVGILLVFGVQAIIVALPSRRNRLVPLMVAVAFLVLHLYAAHVASRRLEALASARQVLIDTSAWIRESAGDEDCTVYTSYLPHITWYTRCTSKTMDTLRHAQPEDASRRRYLVLFENGKRQLPSKTLGAWGIDVKYPDATIDDQDGTIGTARIYAEP